MSTDTIATRALQPTRTPYSRILQCETTKPSLLTYYSTTAYLRRARRISSAFLIAFATPSSSSFSSATRLSTLTTRLNDRCFLLVCSSSDATCTDGRRRAGIVCHAHLWLGCCVVFGCIVAYTKHLKRRAPQESVKRQDCEVRRFCTVHTSHISGTRCYGIVHVSHRVVISRLLFEYYSSSTSPMLLCTINTVNCKTIGYHVR